MTAEILAVGTELLLGNIVNTNARFLSRELAGLGIPVYGHTVVGDNAARLRAALTYAFTKADIVIATGGLGPTQDDITKEVAAALFGVALELHKPSWAAIQRRYIGRDLPDNVRRNAMVPAGCRVLQNDHGSAPGIILKGRVNLSACDGTGVDKLLMLLPGPPHELEPMFITYAVPFLRTKMEQIFVSRTLRVTKLGEARMENLLRDMIDAQTNPTLAPYAKLAECELRITAAAESEAAAHALIAPVVREVYARLGDNIYGEDEDSLASVVLDQLRKRGLTIACAESCTGGLLTAALVGVPGCSAVLNEAMITYSNDAKVARLGVNPALLAAHGAVSAPVAAAMAEGAARYTGADVGIAITGVAGPDGGTKDKPVGTVHVGLYIAEQRTVTQHLLLSGDRSEVRTRAVVEALDMLRRSLL